MHACMHACMHAVAGAVSHCLDWYRVAVDQYYTLSPVTSDLYHVRALLLFRQPTFQQLQMGIDIQMPCVL